MREQQVALAGCANERVEHARALREVSILPKIISPDRDTLSPTPKT
jgi:hypothetical protein